MSDTPTDINKTDWSPERKIVSAAAAVLLLSLATVIFGWEVPVGVEGALAVIIGYFVPNKKG